MNQFGFCPACQTPLNEENQFANSIVCSCGYTMANKTTSRADRSIHMRISSILVAIGVVMAAAFIHAVNWDNHFFSVIPLKLKQITGSADSDDLQALIEICRDRMKYECMEEAYREIYRQNPENIEVLAEWGRLQERRGKNIEAAKTLGQYFDLEGEDLHAAYTYAKVLGSLGRVDEATAYYKRVLKAKPDVLQITVTKSYVSMLLEQQKLKEAKEIIEHYRKRGTNTGYFMDQELKAIKRQLASNS